MKTRMDPNSIESFKDIMNELPERRRAVLWVIYDYQSHGITSFNIAEILKLKINQVTGRINELMHMQLIRIHSKEISGGRSRNRYTIRLSSDPENVFDDDLQSRIGNFLIDIQNDSGIDMISKERIRQLTIKYYLL